MTGMLDIAMDVLTDAVVDTLKLLPFLFVTYLAMEALESAAGERATRVVERAGRLGPVFGALLGAVPQCGFSAAAATLYAGRVVTVGTLLAVFLSTGDELLPVFLSEGGDAGQLLRIFAVKAALAVAVGLAVDAVLRLMHRAGDGHIHVHELCEREHCGCDGEDEAGGGQPEDGTEPAGAASVVRGVVMGAVHHTLQVTLFIFLVTLAINAAIELVGGTDVLAGFVAGNPALSVVAAGVVGLIPNCAASVVVAELFLEGTIGSAALLAGTLVSAGIGLLVLFRTNAGVRQNLLVALALWVAGVGCGLLMLLTGLSF